MPVCGEQLMKCDYLSWLKKGARIRLTLPDTLNSIVLNDLPKRFNKTLERIKAKS